MTKSRRTALLTIALLLIAISATVALKILAQLGVSIQTLVLGVPGAAAGLIGAGMLWEFGSWVWERVDVMVKRHTEVAPVPRLRT